MKAPSLIVILFFFLSAATSSVSAFTVPPRPAQGVVHDDAGILSPSALQSINTLAEELYQKTGFALGVALLNDIGDEDARSAALSTATAWGLGKKGQDEAALLFVALKQRRRSIEVGYGAEGYLPDVLMERIQQRTLVPAFREQRYESGVVLAAATIAATVAQHKEVELASLRDIHPVPASRQVAAKQEPQEGFSPVFLIFLVLILVVSLSRKSSRNRGFRGGPPFITGGFSGGFGRSGGGFSGGFGGFGGGGFGGGGSGGSW